MKVVEIFESIDGEGIRAGFPVTFIRLYGCNLNCSYCDSRYACENNMYTEMSISDILKVIREYGHKRITLTGGEPLLHEGVSELIDDLIYHRYEVNIETNGSVDIHDYGLTSNPQLILTVDYKCPSSGMENKMLLNNLSYLHEKDVLKFVVGTQEDLHRAKDIITNYDMSGQCNIYFSPVFGSIEPKDIVKFILDNKLEDVKVQLQLHKFIWNPEMRGV